MSNENKFPLKKTKRKRWTHSRQTTVRVTSDRREERYMGGGGGGRARVEGHRRQRDGRVIDLHLPTGREGGRRGGGGNAGKVSVEWYCAVRMGAGKAVTSEGGVGGFSGAPRAFFTRTRDLRHVSPRHENARPPSHITPITCNSRCRLCSAFSSSLQR